MRWRAAILLWLGSLAVGASLLFAVQQGLAGSWLAFGVHPQVQERLEAARQDLRTLAELDPAHRGAYRERFDGVQDLLGHLRILEHNREALIRRFQWIVGVLFLGVALLSAAVWMVRQGRLEARLEGVRGWLEALSRGEVVKAGQRRRDTVGRIAGMIEAVSRTVDRDRRRLRTLRHLSAWQEAARRQAHEIKTPLAAARLELARLGEFLPSGEAPRRLASLAQELDRLDRFSREFTTFARLPAPRLETVDLKALVAEFVATFGGAWKNLHLAWGDGTLPGTSVPCVWADREQLRQVLVNLCDNAALALAREPDRSAGTVEMTLRVQPGGVLLEVTDDGPGVPETIRERLFEPYISGSGEDRGMGLGLAISKKILLDHGGDLELVPGGPGATFRLTFPHQPASSGASGPEDVPP